MPKSRVCSSYVLGERIVEKIAEHIAAGVRRYLQMFGGRERRVPPWVEG